MKTAILKIVLCFGMALTALVLRAEEPSGLDHTTRLWLELQRSGRAASSHRQTLSGPVAQAIYKRYMESFKHPVPDLYYQDKTKASRD